MPYAVLLLTGYSVDMLAHSKRLLDAAKAEGVDHIVHLGAMAADDTPYAPLAWHQLIERAIEAMNFSWTHLHPNFFMDTVWSGFLHRPDRLVHYRERVGGEGVPPRDRGQQHRVTGLQPAAAPQRGGNHDPGPGRHGDHAARVAAGDHHPGLAAGR